MLATFLVYSILYKWQSTGSRLQLPWFALLAPLVGVLWEQAGRRWIRYSLAGFLLVAALPFVFNNPSRPFLPFRGDPQTLWNTARETLLFRNNPAIQPGYESMSAALRATGCEQVGLRIDSSDPEYVIWALAAEFEHLVRFEHLFPDPPVVEGREQEYSPCAVICTICNKEVMYALPLHSVHPGGIRLYSQK